MTSTDTFRDSVPHVTVTDGHVVAVNDATGDELGVDAKPLLGPLEMIGKRLDDISFDDVCRGDGTLRVRLGPELDDRPIRLRRLDAVGDTVWLEIRSLAHEFRLESLLRRSGLAHMLISPEIELEWSLSSNELSEVLPGDDPMSWIELMDADDMQTLGRAIFAVGADPNLQRTVSHRLNADRTHTVIDMVESAIHDPDLRAVLVRSRLGDLSAITGDHHAEPYAGITVSDHMPIGVVIASMSGKVLHRNAVAAELVGARVGQMVVPQPDEPWMLSRLDPDDSARYEAVFAGALAGQPAHCTITSPFEHGRWLRVSVSPGAASTVVMTIEDTTDLAEAERALRASTRLREALESHSSDLVVVFDALGHNRYDNSSARRNMGRGIDVGDLDDLVDFVHPADLAGVQDLLRSVRSRPGASGELHFRVIAADGGVDRWHHATMTNHLDDPDINGLVLTVRDVHERHLAELELEYKATHDALTTLPDRAALQSRLDAHLVETANDASATAVMFFDLDNFKVINDRAGHRIGDLVLRTVAERLRASLRASDFVGRFGGDEFVVVTPGVADEAHALELARRVFDAVAGPACCDGIDVDIAMSMGVAVSGPDCKTSAGLLHRADVAMYQAKQSGRGRAVAYSAEAFGHRPDDTLQAEFRVALGARQLTLHYQPLVPLRSGLSRGFESLARWDHPTRGTLAAGSFLHLAESAGLTTELGDELVRLVCDDERPWWTAAGDDFVCINLSSAQLGDTDAARRLLRKLDEAGVRPSRIVVELTEAAFGQGPFVQANLATFRDAGVRVFLDDFGVGYSSLSHLHHFPVDGIKIDASAINPVVDESLVRLIVGVASTLDIRTVAEGVETDEQLDVVVRLGVDYAQGYLLGKPARIPIATNAR